MRRMQKHKNRLKQQRKNSPQKRVKQRNMPECPECGATNQQVPVSPFNYVCLECLHKYPRKTLLVVG